MLCLGLVVCLPGCGDGRDATAGGASTGLGREASDYKGGEKSIEEFGAEAHGAERSAILLAERSYLSALAGRAFGEACGYLSTPLKGSLARISGGKAGPGCSAQLPGLLSPSAAAISRQQAAGRVAKVRVEGDRGFVVFHAPGAKLYQFTMVREGGDWKVATLVSSVLVPNFGSL